MVSRAVRCPNQNHLRPNAPVRHCPQCGDVVNGEVASQSCSVPTHDKQRRNQSLYCIHCGEQLRVPR